MKQLGIAALLTCGLVVPAVARQDVRLSLPTLTPPTGAKEISGGGSYPIPGHPTPADIAPTAVSMYSRLRTTLPVAAIADHYLQQLKAAGWRATLTKIEPSWAFVRLSGGSESEPFVGGLYVVPFPELQNALAAVELVRARRPWPAAGRTGGGGAGATAGFQLSVDDFTDSERPFVKSFTLPPQVTRVLAHEGGGSVDYFLDSVRLETFLSPAALMKIVEPQVIAGGWKVDARAGDAVQAVTLFSPPPGGDSRAVLALTMMPGTHELDLNLSVIRNRR